MNAKKANMIPIIDYLEAKGIGPEKRNKIYSMYKAPYREDTAASLKVSHKVNLWIDYGEENNGGTLIDLVLKFNPGFSVSEAIKDIHQTTGLFFSFHQQNKSIETRNETLQVSIPTGPELKTEKPKANFAFGTSSLQDANCNQQEGCCIMPTAETKLQTPDCSLQSAKQKIAKNYSGNKEKVLANTATSNRYHPKDIPGTSKTGADKIQYLKDKKDNINICNLQGLGNNPMITSYLNQRGIQTTKAEPYCKEIYYQVNGKKYFGLANQNNNGWSIRNKYWKGCTAQGYSYYPNHQPSILLFEGIFDLLSYVELNPDKINDYLVLNSLVNIKHVIPILKCHKDIHLYLDNDIAGCKATESLLQQFPNAVDQSTLYNSCKDLNEYHLKKLDQ